jgi:ATP-dependent DNA ligase
MFGRPDNSPWKGPVCSTLCVGTTSRPPRWIKPQLTRLVDEAPAGAGWLHEIKYDGYRMHARRLDGII